MEITPEQIRAARALLRIEQEELARRLKMSVVTVRRLETADPAPRTSQSTREEVQRVLEQAGAEFIEGGVRRRRTARPDATSRFEALRAISRRSAERLRGREQLTDA
ncbi:MAG: helix-turn-helix domain-containing protein, partial [Acetobacteraceae bacterium]